MKKRGSISLFLVLSVLFLMPIIFAAKSVDSEMQKITHYAEEYETGNINYVKLMLYISSARESLNEVLGATSKNIGGIVKQEKLKEILGEPNEQTKWVWIEGEEHDAKLDKDVPIWKKIVFDGKKIQIRIEAFPSIFKKHKFDDEFMDEEEKEGFEEEMPEEGSIIYRLHFETEFKKPQEQLDIQGKINEIQELAESGASMETLAKESVAAEMIFNNYFKQGGGKCEDIMKTVFGSENQRQTQQILLNEIEFFEGDNFEAILRLEMCDKCEWNWINMDMRLEGRGNFKHPKDTKDLDEKESKERFEGMSEGGFKVETKELISEIIKFLEMGDYGPAMAYMDRLRMLTEAWNQKANDVWKQIGEQKEDRVRTIEKTENKEREVVENKAFKGNNQESVVVENAEGESNKDNTKVENTLIGDTILTENFITGYVIKENNEQSEESRDPYYWIKQDQLQKQKAKELRKRNYEDRKKFYLDLFSEYEKQEYYFEQTDFEKRLIEEFKERGEEICNNNKDDNDNEQVDCDDTQCGGKICGKGTTAIEGKNGTIEQEVNFYCISGTCQAKEEINKSKGPVCGNHICEEGEEVCSSSIIDCNENNTECSATANCGPIHCPEDCIECPIYDAIECSGRVEFAGEDEKGCLLPPICIEEKLFCNNDLDCPQPTCGVAKCIKENEEQQGICKVTELTLCGQKECEDGGKQIKECDNKEKITSSVCVGGGWIDIDAKCSEGDEGEDCDEKCMNYLSTMMPECPGDLKISGSYPDCNCKWICKEISGDECITKDDCGGENDVCSNGRCETIPEIILVEPEEPKVEEEEIEEEEDEEEQEEIEVEPEQEEPAPEPKSEPEPKPQESNEVTGNAIFRFVKGLLSGFTITGYAVEEGIDNIKSDSGGDEPQEEPLTEEPPSNEQPPEDDGQDPGPGPEPDNDCADKWKACGGPCPPCDYDKGPEGDWEEDNWKDDSEDWERKDKEERERHEKENKERCEKECIRPCVEKCIREICGDEMDCNIDKESKACEEECSPDEDCIKKCMSGKEDWWKEFEDEDMHKEEKGVFMVGGGCRKEQGRTEGYIWFNGWGDPYEQLDRLKHKYYEFGDKDWCKHEIDNLIKQRQEFEKGFNQEFAVWFFEKYLPNSAEEWEQSVSGIFELYWSDVDNQMRLAHNMQCLEKNDITELMNVNLINIEYETEYGSLEYWEEIKEVKMPGMDKKVTVISPYMKIWIFPPKSFIIYEMQESMKNGEFPGSPKEKLERKNQEGPTEKEKEKIRQDKGFMRDIKKLEEEYGGSLDFVVQFKDYENNEVVFNLYAQVNEKDIIKVKPMLPSEVPQEDVKVELDFEPLYDIIYTSEKEMRGTMLESPPWDKKIQPIQKVKEVINGAKMFFKMRKLMSSAKYYPADAEGDVEDIFKEFLMGMMGPGGKEKESLSKKEVEEMKEQGRKKAEEMGIELSDEDMKEFEEMGKEGKLDEKEIKKKLVGKTVFD